MVARIDQLIDAIKAGVAWHTFNEVASGGTAYQATSSEFTLMCLKFKDSEGAVCYAGIATVFKGPLIINLPPVLAKQLFEMAVASLS